MAQVMSSRPRVALVVKKTAWQRDVEGLRSARFRRLLRDGDPTVARFRATHDEHEATVAEVVRTLEACGASLTHVELAHGDARGRGPLASRRFDLVVTVGGDGTLLRASHALGATPILAVNSAPRSSVGFFCGATRQSVPVAIPRALDGTLRRVVLARMLVRLNGRVIVPRVLNDCLFCHASPAATSRYLVRLGRVEEEQKSSGFWIGPAAGSTAAQRSAGGRVLPLSSHQLQLVVREPYRPLGERYRLVRELVQPGRELVVKSKMHEARLFPDGQDHIELGFGDEVTFAEAPEPLVLLGRAARRRPRGLEG
jgi:NAD+ kinase